MDLAGVIMQPSRTQRLCVVGSNAVNRHSAKFQNCEFSNAQTFPLRAFNLIINELRQHCELVTF